MTVPTKAHVYAQVPVAWALRAAGHEVCVATNPDLVEDVTCTGLTAVGVGSALGQAEMVEENRLRVEEQETDVPDGDFPDPEELLKLDDVAPETLTNDYMTGLFTVMSTLVFRTFSPVDMTDDLVAFAREWQPDLVVWDTLVFAGPVAAKACGAAHARLLYGLDLIGRMRDRHLDALRSLPEEIREDPLEEWLGLVLDRYGCRFTEDAVLGQWTIDPVPTSMRLPVGHHYVPVRFVPYNGQAEVPGWLREPPKRRRVCLTLGLSFREVMGGDRVSVTELLEAVAGLDTEVVATLDEGQLAGIRQVPDNMRAVGFVPLNELLPSCSAIVHQGGFGQLQTAMAHGVPQIILPNQKWDTRSRARQIDAAGAGLHVADAARFGTAELRSMLKRVLDEPSFAANAAKLREEMAGTPTPSDIVPVLERLTAEHRSARLDRARTGQAGRSGGPVSARYQSMAYRW